jgi:HSP20 family protein
MRHSIEYRGKDEMEDTDMLPVKVERRRNYPSRWLEPFADMDVMTNFDRLVDRVFGGHEARSEFYPADVWEDENTIHVEMELPGFKSGEVNVSYEEGLLRIEGERKPIEHKGNVYLAERSFGKFIRTFQIPNVVNAGEIRATFKEGILEIQCEKKPETKPHKIEVKTT